MRSIRAQPSARRPIVNRSGISLAVRGREDVSAAAELVPVPVELSVASVVAPVLVVAPVPVVWVPVVPVAESVVEPFVL